MTNNSLWPWSNWAACTVPQFADLRKEVLPLNARNFAILAEGPVDEIRRLEEHIGDYTGQR